MPFVSFGAGAGVEKPSKYTVEGAAEDELTYPGNQHFPDPLPNFVTGINVLWQLDIWRELRNARDAAMQRYVSRHASDGTTSSRIWWRRLPRITTALRRSTNGC